MNWPLLLLAADPFADPAVDALKNSNSSSSLTPQTIWIGGTVLALAILLLVWAFFIRRHPGRDGEVLYRSRDSARREPPPRAGLFGHKRKRRRKSGHSEHIRRNPTLAEAGGLPPLRPEEPENPSTS